MAQSRILVALCTSDASNEHTDTLLQSLEGLIHGENVGADGEDRSNLLLVRSCARALATRVAEPFEDGRIRRIVDTICSVILSLVSTGSSPDRVGWAGTAVDVVDVHGRASLARWVPALPVPHATSWRDVPQTLRGTVAGNRPAGSPC